MKQTFKALLLGGVCEALAFACLLFGKWEFLGELDILGALGMLLHAPGFVVAGQMDAGNYGWFAIIGVPYLLWSILSLLLLNTVGSLVQKPTRRAAEEP